MSPESSRESEPGANYSWKLALTVWAVLMVVICWRPLLQPGKNDVSDLWSRTGRAWYHAQPIYRTANDYEAFRYSPVLAVVYLPMGMLPDQVGGILWRLLSALVLLVGVWRWLRDAAPVRLTRAQLGWFLLLLAPLSLASLNNGQANTILTGLLLLSLASVARRGWNEAAFWLACAIWLKVYPVALALLLILIYPRQLGWRIPLTVALLGFIPFLSQRGDYVVEQYTIWWDVIGANEGHRRFVPIEMSYRDLLLLLRIWNIPVSLSGYTLLQLLGAAACALAVLHGLLQQLPMQILLLRLFVVSLGWIMLLGPATESSTYVLVGPLVSWLAVWSNSSHAWASRWLLAQTTGLLLLCVFGCAVPLGRTVYHGAGLQPLAILLLLSGYFLAEGSLRKGAGQRFWVGKVSRLMTNWLRAKGCTSIRQAVET